MLAVWFPRWSRVLVGALAVVICAGALLPRERPGRRCAEQHVRFVQDVSPQGVEDGCHEKDLAGRQDGGAAVARAWAEAGREGSPLTNLEQIHAELRRLEKAGCAEVLLFPCTGDLEQVTLLAEALRAGGEQQLLGDADLASESRTNA